MIVAVVELYEDDPACPALYFCDTEKANPYLKRAIESALAGADYEMPYDAGFQWTACDEDGMRIEDSQNPAIIDPPCMVETSVILYTDDTSVWDYEEEEE